jgi:uncharacterized repeat protein (TIGR03803 family)
LAGNTLYGDTVYGGANDSGTLFAVNTDGTGFTNIYSFAAYTTWHWYFFNYDGDAPINTLTYANGQLYGAATGGGESDSGTVFVLSTNGSGFTRLHSFTGGNDGMFPRSTLTLVDNMLYGTANGGGASGEGTLFAIDLNRTSHPVLGFRCDSPDMLLTWPTNPPGYFLQCTTNLTVWTTLSNGVYVLDEFYAFPTNNTVPGQFFRLSQ